MRLLGTRLIPKSYSGLGNPMVWKYCSACVAATRLARAIAVPEPWPTTTPRTGVAKVSIAGRQLEDGVKLAHKCMCQCGWPGCLVLFARS